MKKFLILIACTSTLSGCAGLTPTYETTSAYVIVDGANKPNTSRDAFLREVVEAVQKNGQTKVTVNRSVPPSPLPKQPGNFKLADISNKLPIPGMLPQIPTCESPVLTLNASDNSFASYGQNTTLFVCVMQYAHGYRTAIYAHYSKASGAVSTQALGAMISEKIVGDSSQFIPRVMGDILTSIENNTNNTKITDSYIPETFKGPLQNQLQRLQKTTASKN